MELGAVKAGIELNLPWKSHGCFRTAPPSGSKQFALHPTTKVTPSAAAAREWLTRRPLIGPPSGACTYDVCILTTPFFLFLQTPRNLPFFPFRFGPTLVHTSYVHRHSLPPSLPDACQPFPSSLPSFLVVRRRVTSPQIFILSREEGGRKGNTSRERDPEALAC